MMNNRFKFRVWSKLSNIMSYEVCFGNFFQHSKTEKKAFDWISVSYGDNFISYRGDALKELVLMQSTGLKDKNGKLIYENDIVKITKETWKKDKYHLIYLVCWDRTQWQLGLFKNQRPKAQSNRRSDRQMGLNSIVSFYDYTPKKNFCECEVIGNIYENPELLKECEG